MLFIGIVMELCNTSLAKRLEEQAVAVNWAENVRLLMDGTAGLAFIHQNNKDHVVISSLTTFSFSRAGSRWQTLALQQCGAPSRT